MGAHDPPRFVLMDVFTGRAFSGNRLAVVLGAQGMGTRAMQRWAREFGFSETTFVTRHGGDHAEVRIFTPRQEVPFAGHPVLGTAAALWGDGTRAGSLTLRLRAGAVEVRRMRDGSYWFDHPDWRLGERVGPAEAAASLGLPPAGLHPRLGPQVVSTGFPVIVVPLAGRAALQRIRPAAAAHEALVSRCEAKAVLAFARAPGGRHWESRFFAPFYGVAEDAATGSASGALAVYLHSRGELRHGTKARISQGRSVGRPSTIWARTHADRRVEVGGRAVRVASGTLEA